MSTSLQSAIQDAMKTHESDLAGSDSTETTVEKTEAAAGDETTETAKSTETKTEPEVDEDAVQGKNLILALRDPEKSHIVIDFLAKQAGYTKSEIKNIDTKQEIKDLKKDLTKELEESLGDDLKFLAGKLGPAIDKYLEGKLPSNTQSDEAKNLKARLDERDLKDLQSEAAKIHVTIAQEYFGSDDMPDNVTKALSEAMDEFPPSSNMGVEKYYRKIFSLVAGELSLTKKTRAQVDKTEKNRQDSPARNLSSTNKGVTPNADGNAKKMSLNDAVNLALKQVEQAGTRK